MTEAIRVNLDEIADMVKTAAIPDEQKRTAAWCIEQLPPLYDNFCRTYESRFGDQIVRLEQGMLLQVTGKPPVGSEAQALGVAITACLKGMHERLGLPLLDPKLPPAPRPRKAKAKAR